jgi:hypothetical protein
VRITRGRPSNRPLLLLEAGDGAVDEVDHLRGKRHGQEETPGCDGRSFFRSSLRECRSWWATSAFCHEWEYTGAMRDLLYG